MSDFEKFTSGELTRIANDTNGNPRYVMHYTALANTYTEALHIAKQRGGRKFHNKQFGGGIVFQEYNTKDLVEWVKCINITCKENNNA